MHRCLVSCRAASALGSEESWTRKGARKASGVRTRPGRARDGCGVMYGDAPGTCMGSCGLTRPRCAWDVRGVMCGDAPRTLSGRVWSYVWGHTRDLHADVHGLRCGDPPRTRPGLA